MTSSDSKQKSLPEWLVVTFPAVLLYFVGWTYLYYYLQAFGINLSETDLGIETILLYSLPPIKILFGTYWLQFAAVLLAMIFLLFKTRNISSKYKSRYDIAVSYCTRLPLLIRCGVLLVFFFVAVLALTHTIRIAALHNVAEKWVTAGTQIDALIDQAKAPEKSEAHENYRTCRDRRALDLIFSDKEAYYMLCISSIEPTSAIVFELRRSLGLVSIRSIQKD